MNPIQLFLFALFNKYSKFFYSWHIGFPITCASYIGRVDVKYDSATAITLSFASVDIVLYGVRDAEYLLDYIKDFVEGGVYM